MATKKQIEEAILQREGFRVELELFEGKKETLPPYDWTVMAPQRWHISDWKNTRLKPYRLLVKGINVYRGDGKLVARDLQLGNLRDTYYEQQYGPLRPKGAQPEEDDEKVVELSTRRKKPASRGPATS
jgi:hypothetical protein